MSRYSCSAGVITNASTSIASYCAVSRFNHHNSGISLLSTSQSNGVKRIIRIIRIASASSVSGAAVHGSRAPIETTKLSENPCVETMINSEIDRVSDALIDKPRKNCSQYLMLIISLFPAKSSPILPIIQGQQVSVFSFSTH